MIIFKIIEFFIAFRERKHNGHYLRIKSTYYPKGYIKELNSHRK